MDKLSITFSELRRNPMSVVARITDDGRPGLVTRRGEPLAVLLDIDTFRSMTQEHELLRRLALGELESAVGRGAPMADVLDECDLLFEEN
jgi:prevent-host-death family protein